MKVAFDVDDTIYKINAKYMRQEPDFELIAVLRWFANNGDEVFVWSGGGVEYAQTIVDKFGLTDLVKVIPKQAFSTQHSEMDLAFDDCEIGLAKVNALVQRPKHNLAPKRG